MDWCRNHIKPFVSPPQDDNSYNFLYNYNYDQCPVTDTKHPLYAPSVTIKEKKKRLTSEQLESLEKSFQEETKLDPDRKTKLSKELGIQPREIAIWFQNRRARWKTKQLERLYDELKQKFDVVSSEKQKLQEEVVVLRTILKGQAGKKQVSNDYTEISRDKTVESTSTPSSNKPQGTSNIIINQNHMDSDYVFNVVDDYNQVSQPCWTPLPSYQ